LRASATSVGVPVITTVAELTAAVQAIEAMRAYPWSVASLQEHAQTLATAREAELSGAPLVAGRG
jgi:carbamoyl-phosphate synthase large subunit